MKVANGGAQRPQHRRSIFSEAEEYAWLILERVGGNRVARSLLLAIFLAATAVGLVSADPGNRTVTTTTSSWRRCTYQANLLSPYSGSCTLTLYRASCPSASSTMPYFNSNPNACGSSWPVTCTGATCTVSQTGSATVSCNPVNDGPECTSSTSTTTYPPATISVGAQSCSQPGSGGWCLGGLSLPLTGNEPWTTYRITDIESDLFGTICTGNASTLNCTLNVPEGNHTARFRSRSSFGDTSYWSSQTSLRVDGTPPSAGLSVPPVDGQGGWHVSPLTATASGSDAISGVASISINSGGSSLDLTADGVYDLTAVVCDAAGNCSSTGQTVRLDLTPPQSAFTSPANGATVYETVTLQGQTAEATSGLAALEISLDNGATWRPLSPASSWSYTWDTKGVPNGTYTILARAADAAGHQENTASLTLVIDNRPPAVFITNDWWYWQTADVSIRSGTLPVEGARITISDGKGNFRKFEFPRGDFPANFRWNGLWENRSAVAPPGSYRVVLEAWDKFGNTGVSVGVVRVPEPKPTAVPPTATAEPTAVPRPTATAVPAAPTSVPPEPPIVPDPVAAGIAIVVWPLIGFLGLLVALASSSLTDGRPRALRRLADNIFPSER